MEKIRINNDMRVNFSVYRNGQPESFDGASNISTKLVNEAYNKEITHTYTIAGNVVQFDIDALQLAQCGKCRLFISYTKGGDYTVDSPAFELVNYTDQTGGTEIIGVEIVSINISGDIGINRDGLSAYEVWEAYPGNEGKTIEQYFEWLRENPTKIDLDGLNSNLDKLHFKPDTLVKLTNIGDVRYSQESRTLEVKVSDTVSIQLGQEMQTRVKNDEAIQINNGQMVYINSAVGANPLAKIASTSNTDVAQRTFGMATENIPANGFGAITTEGLVRDINTSAFPEGAMLWLGTNGSITNIEPTAPTSKISVGMVLRSNANNGVVYVKIRAIARNQKLSDVYAPTLTGGDILRWNSTTLRFEVYNINTALSSKADTSRKIIAGLGLTGGGDFTTDKTIDIGATDDSIAVAADGIKANTVDNLTTTSPTKPLSANQGKVLNEKVVKVETDLNTIDFSINSKSNKVLAIVGQDYLNQIDVIIESGVDFEINIDGITDKLNNYFLYINNSVYSSYNSAVNVINLKFDYIVTSVKIQRNGINVISSGETIMSIYLKDSVYNRLKNAEHLADSSYNTSQINSKQINGIYNNFIVEESLSPILNSGKFYTADSVIPATFSGLYTTPENAIPITQYRGKKLLIDYNTISDTSGRCCLITDEFDNILIFIMEKSMEFINGRYKSTITIPINASKIYISFSNLVTDYLFMIGTEIFQDIYKIIHVDSINGNDQNDGSEKFPLSTFDRALKITGNNTTIIFSGDTNEQINVKTKDSQSSIRLIGKYGCKNRIVRGTKITNAILVENNVYQASVLSFQSLANYAIFQHDIDDINTFIDEAERLPQQIGKQYRCEHTQITRNTSLENVISASGYTYFYDNVNYILYFKAPSADFINHPIVMPVDSDRGIYGNDGTVHLEILNMEFLYCMANFDYSHGAIVKDCKAGYNCGSGGFRYNLSVGIEFIRCEAARVNNGTSNGDGFNAHANINAIEFGNAPVFSKHISATLIDCWSHDNKDDGYSDHERSETVIRGGLFEYNGKGGIVPSYGSHCSCYNVVSRNNFSGFYYVGSVSDVTPSEGGKYGQLFCINCIASKNLNETSGYGFGVHGAYNCLVLKDCISIENKVGYYCTDTTNQIKLINCKSLNDLTIKSPVGNFIVNNGSLVE